MARGFGSLATAGPPRLPPLDARVLEPGGQRVDATDRLYLAEEMPSLIMWGRSDPMIPVSHAGVAQRGMPGSELELFDDAGHFPMLDEPRRFARRLSRFVESTEAAELTADDLRERVLAGAPQPSTEPAPARAAGKGRKAAARGTAGTSRKAARR